MTRRTIFAALTLLTLSFSLQADPNVLPAASETVVSADTANLIVQAQTDLVADRFAEAVAVLETPPPAASPEDITALQFAIAAVQYAWGQHLQTNSPALALAHYQAALAIDGPLRPAQAANDLVSLGNAYDDLSQYSKEIGVYQQAVPLFQQVADQDGEANALMNLGNAYNSLSQPSKAISFYQQALPLFKQFGDKDGEANTLLNLGSAYFSLSEDSKALGFFHQALPLFQQIGDKGGEATALSNMAIAGNHPYVPMLTAPAPPAASIPPPPAPALPTASAAVVSTGTARLIVQAQADLKANRFAEAVAALKAPPGAASSAADTRALKKAAAYVQYAWARSLTADSPALALAHYQAALALDLTRHSAQAADDLTGLGLVYDVLNRPGKALGFYQQALPLFEQIGDKGGTASALIGMGNAHLNLNHYAKALRFYQQALPLFQRLGDKDGTAKALMNQGTVYRSLSQYNKALGFFQQALPLFQQVGDKEGEASTLNNIGLADSELSRYSKALGCFQQALPLCRQIGDRNGEASTLGNFGLAYASLKQYSKALGFFQQAFSVYQQIGDQRGQLQARNDIDNILKYLKSHGFPAVRH